MSGQQYGGSNDIPDPATMTGIEWITFARSFNGYAWVAEVTGLDPTPETLAAHTTTPVRRAFTEGNGLSAFSEDEIRATLFYHVRADYFAGGYMFSEKDGNEETFQRALVAELKSRAD